MKRWSISRQLLVRLLLSLAALWVCAAAAAVYVVTDETNEVYDNALAETARLIATLLPKTDDARNPDWSQTLEGVALSGDRSDYMSFHILSPTGKILQRSAKAPHERFPAPVRSGFKSVGSTRYFTILLDDNRGAIQVAETPEERHEAFYGLLAGFLVPLCGLLLGGALLVWRAVNQASVPIKSLATEIGNRDGSSLHPLEAMDVPDELRPIVGNTNRLLSRLNRALNAERAFAANWAHELRNPVAAAKAQADLIVESSTYDRTRAEMLALSLRNLGQRVERLLQKSRADASGISEEPADLLAVAELVIDGYYYLPEGRKIVLEDNGLTALPTTIGQDSLAIVLQNLIDNAIAHSPPRSVIAVNVDSGPAVSVVNDGPIVSADDLGKIQSRFQRGRNSGASGFGLGLHIVQTIVSQAGGDMRLYSPAREHDAGFEVVLHFARQQATSSARQRPAERALKVL